jgi:hypothetical protein
MRSRGIKLILLCEKNLVNSSDLKKNDKNKFALSLRTVNLLNIN